MKPLTKKTAAALAMIAAIILTGWAAGNAGAEEVGEKRIPVMVEEGDTIWDLCRKVATDRDNLGRMAFYTMAENNITEPGSIQPGTVITIVVPER